jgi:purine-binding chemotaxis protein CheW
VNKLHVLFKVADADYVLPAADVLHMESFSGVTEVPGTPDYVAGLVQIRQRVVPVVNLRARFGLPKAEPTLDSRVVVVQCGQRTVGLLVDSAREILNIEADDFRPPPELIARQSQGYITSVLRSGARLLLLMDPEKVIGEEVQSGK